MEEVPRTILKSISVLCQNQNQLSLPDLNLCKPKSVFYPYSKSFLNLNQPYPSFINLLLLCSPLHNRGCQEALDGMIPI